MGIIKPGYMGIARIGGSKIKFTSCSLNPQQSVLWYDHTIGLNDTVTSASKTKGQKIGTPQIQKTLWRPGTITAQGSIGFPLTESGDGGLFKAARTGSEIDIDISYNCEMGRKYSKCRVASYDFSCTAGGIANISCELMCKETTPGGGESGSSKVEKLITWDKINVTGSDIPSAIQGVSVKINNNAQPVYTSESLYPSDIRLGMQEVTGSIMVYVEAGVIEIGDKPSNITIKSEGISISIEAIFMPSTIEASVGPVITTLPFTGALK